MFPADEGYVLPQPEQIDPATFDASTVVSPQSAGFVAEAGETAQPTARRRRLQQAATGLPVFGGVTPADPEVEDPTELEAEEVEAPEAPEDEGPEEAVGPRPAGVQPMCLDGRQRSQRPSALPHRHLQALFLVCPPCADRMLSVCLQATGCGGCVTRTTSASTGGRTRRTTATWARLRRTAASQTPTRWRSATQC